MSTTNDDKKADGGDLDAVTARINSLMAKTPAADEKKTGGAEGDEKKDTPATSATDSKPAAATDKTEAAAATSSAAAGPSSPKQEKDKDGNLLESKYDVTVTLADQQADPNSPLYSVKSFDQLGLSEELLKGIYSMKYQKPSKIQERALPLLLQNPPRNMIGQSQSGTGKTAAFVLTMLSRVDFSLNAPQAIALARE